MQHWLRLGTRNWRAKRVRTFGAMIAVALGTAAVVWVTCCHESVRQAVMEWAQNYVGSAHISVTSAMGKHGQIPQRLVRQLESIENVAVVTPLLQLRRSCELASAADWAVFSHSGRRWDPDNPEVDLSGIDLETEFAIRQYSLTAGRMLTKDDGFACVLEGELCPRRESRPGGFPADVGPFTRSAECLRDCGFV